MVVCRWVASRLWFVKLCEMLWKLPLLQWSGVLLASLRLTMKTNAPLQFHAKIAMSWCSACSDLSCVCNIQKNTINCRVAGGDGSHIVAILNTNEYPAGSVSFRRQSVAHCKIYAFLIAAIIFRSSLTWFNICLGPAASQWGDEGALPFAFAFAVVHLLTINTRFAEWCSTSATSYCPFAILVSFRHIQNLY